jgi:hypothetical protein
MACRLCIMLVPSYFPSFANYATTNITIITIGQLPPQAFK